MTTRSRLVALLALTALLAGCAQRTTPEHTTPQHTATKSTASVSQTPTTSAPTTSAPKPKPTPTPTPMKPAVTTPAGMWWGVDSSGPMTDAGLAAVKAWYRGATPQVWGRYLNGHYAVTKTELSWARAHGIYVDLLVPDDNCSQCAGGGDYCDNDETAAQATADARAALTAARQLAVPRGAILFKDVEQVSSCIGEPTANYIQAWYRAARDSGYRVGMYGNSTNAGFAFARSYCQVVARDHRFADEVLLDATEPEPNLGLPAGVDGPTKAPAFHPDMPPCAKTTATTAWQYGESVDSDNYADIDQIRPRTPGLLAPNGSVTP